MKFLDNIKNTLKYVTTATLLLGSIVAALSAFTNYWNDNDKSTKP